MRIVLAFALASLALALTVETQHFRVTVHDGIADAQGVASVLAGLLEEAYSSYASRGLQPAPPCDGAPRYSVEYPVPQAAPGVTRVRFHGDGRCVEGVYIKQGYHGDRHVAYHEVAHVFHANYVPSPEAMDQWPSEAIPEAMAATYTGDYSWTQAYFAGHMWAVDPYSTQGSQWYAYSAAFVWYLAGRQDWGGPMAYASSSPAEVYVQFLLALARGVTLGGRTYAPSYQQASLSGGQLSIQASLDGYTARYYKVSLDPGTVSIDVEGPGLVNLATGTPFQVDNGTLLLAVVNGGPTRASITVTISHTSPFSAEVLGGSYVDGVISLQLNVRRGGQPLEGQAHINGTPVSFSGGRGTYVFTGGLRQYVLRLQYGSEVGYVKVLLRPLQLEVQPGVLYLGRGGRGGLTVRAVNPNPISVSCLLQASASGVQFSQARLEVEAGGSSSAALSFAVVGTPGDSASASCAGASASAAIRRFQYVVRYDVDAGSGRVETPFGAYAVGRLPASVELSLGSYVAAVVEVLPPNVTAEAGRPVFDLDRFLFPLRVTVTAPPGHVYRGTVSIDGQSRPVEVSGAVQLAFNVSATGPREVAARFGPYEARLVLRPPPLELRLTPLHAMADGSSLRLDVKVGLNVDYIRLPEVEFSPRPGGRQGDTYRFSLGYAENVTILYSSVAGSGSLALRLPRPTVSLAAVRANASAQSVEVLLNLTASVCGPSVNSTYLLGLPDAVMRLEVPAGKCASAWRPARAAVPYSPEASVEVPTSFGPASVALHLPRPSLALKPVEIRVEPSSVSALLNLTASVCGSSADARYLLELPNATLALEVPRGKCAAATAPARARWPYSPRIQVEVWTSFGVALLTLWAPPPAVNASVAMWTVEGARERAVVKLRAAAPGNYTYVMLGREFRGLLEALLEVAPASGTAEVDYGFGRIQLARPALQVEAPWALAPLGRPLNLTVRLRAPHNLNVTGVLEVGPAGVPLSLAPGQSREVSVALQSPDAPGHYVVEVRLGPYRASANATWATAALEVRGLRLLPVGAPARLEVVARVRPPVPLNVTLEASGCLSGRLAVPPNSTATLGPPGGPCVARVAAGLLDAWAEVEVRWASLVARVEYEGLGVHGGMPVFAAGSLKPSADLGGLKLEGIDVRTYGDPTALGYVELNVTAEYMGVRNSTVFRGYAVPREDYVRALALMDSMPGDARAGLSALLRRAVETGAWDPLRDLYSLYASGTPMAHLARFAVERQLASGGEPALWLAKALLRWEPAIYAAVAAAALLAACRRG